MKRVLAISAMAAFALTAPAQAGGLLGGSDGLVGLNVGVSTGHVSVANGGIANGNQIGNGINVGNGNGILSRNGTSVLNGNGLNLDFLNKRSRKFRGWGHRW